MEEEKLNKLLNTRFNCRCDNAIGKEMSWKYQALFLVNLKHVERPVWVDLINTVKLN